MFYQKILFWENIIFYNLWVPILYLSEILFKSLQNYKKLWAKICVEKVLSKQINLLAKVRVGKVSTKPQEIKIKSTHVHVRKAPTCIRPSCCHLLTLCRSIPRYRLHIGHAPAVSVVVWSDPLPFRLHRRHHSLSLICPSRLRSSLKVGLDAGHLVPLAMNNVPGDVKDIGHWDELPPILSPSTRLLRFWISVALARRTANCSSLNFISCIYFIARKLYRHFFTGFLLVFINCRDTTVGYFADGLPNSSPSPRGHILFSSGVCQQVEQPPTTSPCDLHLHGPSAPVHCADDSSAPSPSTRTSCGTTTTEHLSVRNVRSSLHQFSSTLFFQHAAALFSIAASGNFPELARTPVRNPNLFYSSNKKQTINKRELRNFTAYPSDTSTSSWRTLRSPITRTQE